MTTASGYIGGRFELVALQTTTTPTYTEPVSLAEAQAGGKFYSAALGTRSYYAEHPHPSTGNQIAGFRWDERVWTDDETENTVSKVPLNWDPTTSGVTNTFFQTGIGSDDDIELLSVVQVPSSGIFSNRYAEVFVPELNHGYFYDYQTEYYLFSDDSEIVYPSYSGVVGGLGLEVADSFSTVSLTSIPKVGIPVQAVQYQWDSSLFQHVPYTIYRKVTEFTGTDTYNSSTDSIVFPNITGENEFTISYSGVTYAGNTRTGLPEAVFSENVSARQGWPSSGNHISFEDLEFLDYSTGVDSEQFHTLYAPIDSSTPVLVFSFPANPGGTLSATVVASGLAGNGLVGGGSIPNGFIDGGSGSVTEWVATPAGTTISGQYNGYQVNIDYDLGLVMFGEASSTVNIPNAGDQIVIAYNKTVRIEYEPEDTGDSVLANEANMNPLYRKSGDGFVILSARDESPASIVLEAELPLMSTNYYGPLNIGNDVGTLVATVYNRRGEVIEGEEVDIFITSTPVIGGFGSATRVSTLTDQDGEARAFYNPPRSVSSLGSDIVASGMTVDSPPVGSGLVYSGVAETTTFTVTDLVVQGEVDEVYLYKIMVDDPSIGYLETSLNQGSIPIQEDEYYRNYFLDNFIYGATGLTSSGTVDHYYGNVTWESIHRTIYELTEPVVYERSTGMGRKVLCSIIDSGVLNPHTFEYVAVAPMQPIDIVETSIGYDVVYDTSIFDLPTPSGSLGVAPSGNHYGYFLVSPTEVSMQASVYNDQQARTITSNEITIKLSIPDSMNGMWIIDELNSIHTSEISSLLSSVIASGQKVPLGFRIRSANLNLAGALDAVTFLDVNPVYNANMWDRDEVPPLGQKVMVSGIT